jgi:hypothetical protein
MLKCFYNASHNPKHHFLKYNEALVEHEVLTAAFQTTLAWLMVLLPRPK